MNLITIHKQHKETLIAAAKRAVNNSSLVNRIVQLNYDGVQALVYPHERMEGVITYVNQQLMVNKYPALQSFLKK